MVAGQTGEQTAHKVSRKGIFSWMMFDWATQPFHTLLLTFVFAPYFTSFVAENSIEGQRLWSLALGVGGIFVALMSPVLGAIADHTGPRKPWILLFSFFAVLGGFALWFTVPGATYAVPIALIGFVIAFIGFEFATVFYNGMMPTLVPRSELGRLSGSAWALGYIGGIISLILVLGMMISDPETGKTLLGGSPLFSLDSATHAGDRAAGPFAAIWYVIFVIPLFLFTPDIFQTRQVATSSIITKSLRDLWGDIKALPKNSSFFAFLSGSMFYRDALNGLYAFGGIYAAGVLGWSIVQIGTFGILANITGAFGAYIGGRFDQKFGPKAVVSFSVILLGIVCLMIVTTSREQLLGFALDPQGANKGLPDILFYTCGAIIGAAGGALQAASRTLLVDQADKEHMNQAFGLYALSGKATSFLAPSLIFIATGLFDSQRLGISPIILLFIIGLICLRWVKEKK